MLILGIDPGPEKSALAVYTHRTRHVWTAEYCNNYSRTDRDTGSIVDQALHWRHSFTAENCNHDSVIAIEYPQNYGQKIGATTLDTAGAACAIARELRIRMEAEQDAENNMPSEVYGISRPTIKRVLLGATTGNDTDVKCALWDAGVSKEHLYRVTGGDHKCAAAAVAFAIGHALEEGELDGWLADTNTRKARRLAA